MTELYLIRHGETELNISGVYYGWTDCDLTQRGIEQCEALQTALKDAPFDVVIASPLKRAVHSASIVSQKKSDDILTDDGLRELNFGEWEGLHFKEIQANHKAHWDKWVEDWKYTAPPSGEGFMDIYNRVKTSLELLLETYKDKKILLVAHQGSLRIIASLLLGMQPEDCWHFMFEQGKYSLFEINDGFCTIRKINGL